MPTQKELLALATRFREFARQTAQDNYAAQLLRTATELEAQALSQRKHQVEQRNTQVA